MKIFVDGMLLFFPEYLPLNLKEFGHLIYSCIFLYRIKLLSKHCTETIKLFYELLNKLSTYVEILLLNLYDDIVMFTISVYSNESLQ